MAGWPRGSARRCSKAASTTRRPGQLLTGSYNDYAMPRADDLPSFALSTHVTLCTHNPLGVKGCGEAGAIGAPAAITNAIVDALKPLGVRHRRHAGDARKSCGALIHQHQHAARRGIGRGPMYEFNYHKPTSLDDAANLLGADEEAKLVAGGMTLIPTLKLRLAKPSRSGRSRPRSPSLQGHHRGRRRDRHRGDDPACRGQPLGRSSSAAIPALAALAGMIGDPAVRNRGTIGGSISNNDPAADYPAALVALDATVRTTKREIARRAISSPACSRPRSSQDEIVTAVRFPKPQAANYQKFRNPASRYAIVGVFVARTAGGVRVAVTGAGPVRLPRPRDGSGARRNPSRPDAIKDIAIPDDGLNSDIHASAEYRAHLVDVMARRAVAACA